MRGLCLFARTAPTRAGESIESNAVAATAAAAAAEHDGSEYLNGPAKVAAGPRAGPRAAPLIAQAHRGTPVTLGPPGSLIIRHFCRLMMPAGKRALLGLRKEPRGDFRAQLSGGQRADLAAMVAEPANKWLEPAH